ncbi:MAG: helix-turn-helix domain-containing protein [Anaerorhabdus sp.]|uniref:helix-turn-helix domain-containing protein n=1 Tax=Anaerorhabdus sp. TaxID=1872524 RepID=UPI003A869D59
MPGALPSPGAAAYIGRSNKTLSNLRAQGKGPRFFRAGDLHSRVYYLVKDLDAWLEEQVSRSGGSAA